MILRSQRCRSGARIPPPGGVPDDCYRVSTQLLVPALLLIRRCGGSGQPGGILIVCAGERAPGARGTAIVLGHPVPRQNSVHNPRYGPPRGRRDAPRDGGAYVKVATARARARAVRRRRPSAGDPAASRGRQLLSDARITASVIPTGPGENMGRARGAGQHCPRGRCSWPPVMAR